MKRRDVLALPLAALGCNRSDRTVIGVAPKGINSIFWQAVEAGARQAAEEADIDILWNGPPQETEYARQIQIVESMINRGVDAIAISPSDQNALVGVVEKAMSMGIPVAVFDSGINTENYVSFVATDNEAAGRMGCAKVSQLVGGSGDVAMVMHVPGSASTSKREIGFEAAVAEEFTGLNIVNKQYCQSDRSRALAIAEDMMTAHPDLDAIFCSSEAATVGASQARKARGLGDRPKLVGFDAAPTLQQNLREGAIDALIIQEPYRMAYLAVEALVNKLAGETPAKQIDSPARVVTAADMDNPEVQKLLNPV